MNQRLAQIAIVVNDYDEAIAFYTQKLNFILIEDTVLNETKRWVVIKPTGEGGCNILLAKAANDEQKNRIGNQTGGRVFLFMHTDDLKRDYENMLANNIEFVRQPSEEVYGTVAVFKDLYGNLWDLIQPKEKMTEFNFSPFPQLSTERLLLRSVQTTDANEIFLLRSDDNVNKYIDRQRAKTIEDARQFIEKMLTNIENNQCLWWAVTLKTESVLAGAFLIWNINKENATAEIGYELLPAYHGKGIAQEAMQAALKFGFNSLKFNSIAAVVHKENISSVKILERNNFELKGEIESNLLEYILFAKDFNRN
jgi:RimJ/RimL family protein N-acetyltransferase/uncharacterized glyoxalase superfamily protein PhnB